MRPSLNRTNDLVREARDVSDTYIRRIVDEIAGNALHVTSSRKLIAESYVLLTALNKEAGSRLNGDVLPPVLSSAET